MTTCGPFKTTEGGIFDATVNSMRACKCFAVQASPASPLPPPSSMLIFFVSHGVGLGWHISLSTLRLWGAGERENDCRVKNSILCLKQTFKLQKLIRLLSARRLEDALIANGAAVWCVVRGAVWSGVMWCGLVWSGTKCYGLVRGEYIHTWACGGHWWTRGGPAVDIGGHGVDMRWTLLDMGWTCGGHWWTC